MTDLSVPQSLLHPLKASVIGFQEEEHDYHFQVEYPDPDACHTCGTIGASLALNSIDDLKAIKAEYQQKLRELKELG